MNFKYFESLNHIKALTTLKAFIAFRTLKDDANLKSA